MGNTPKKDHCPRYETDPPDVEDIENERQRARSKLKAAWEDLIERYGRNLDDESDVIDLVTGEIIEDNGHLRHLAPTTLGGGGRGSGRNGSEGYDSEGYTSEEDWSSNESSGSDNAMGQDFEDVFDSLLIRRRKDVLQGRLSCDNKILSPGNSSAGYSTPNEFNRIHRGGRTVSGNLLSSPPPRFRDLTKFIPESPLSDDNGENGRRIQQPIFRKRTRTPSLTDSEQCVESSFEGDSNSSNEEQDDFARIIMANRIRSLKEERRDAQPVSWDVEDIPFPKNNASKSQNKKRLKQSDVSSSDSTKWGKTQPRLYFRTTNKDTDEEKCDGTKKCSKAFCLKCC